MAKAKPFNIPKREVFGKPSKKMKANQGAAGVDGQGRLPSLRLIFPTTSTGSGIACPQELAFLRRCGGVDLPKGDGRTRPLGIPTVGDRVARARKSSNGIWSPSWSPSSTMTLWIPPRPIRRSTPPPEDPTAVLAVRLGARH